MASREGRKVHMLWGEGGKQTRASYPLLSSGRLVGLSVGASILRPRHFELGFDVLV